MSNISKQNNVPLTHQSTLEIQRRLKLESSQRTRRALATATTQLQAFQQTYAIIKEQVTKEQEIAKAKGTEWLAKQTSQVTNTQTILKTFQSTELIELKPLNLEQQN